MQTYFSIWKRYIDGYQVYDTEMSQMTAQQSKLHIGTLMWVLSNRTAQIVYFQRIACLCERDQTIDKSFTPVHGNQSLLLLNVRCLLALSCLQLKGKYCLGISLVRIDTSVNEEKN